MTDLFDKRSDFFRSYFEKAKPYPQYIASGNAGEQQRWNTARSNIALTPEQIALLGSFTRKLNVLVLSGIWCGDCVRQCPIIQAISEASTKIDLRFIDNEIYPELRDELRIHGAARVPVVVTLSEDFFEINRFGDRPLATYRRKGAKEVGAACDIGGAPKGSNELDAEINQWVDHFERLHLMLRISPYLREKYKD